MQGDKKREEIAGLKMKIHPSRAASRMVWARLLTGNSSEIPCRAPKINPCVSVIVSLPWSWAEKTTGNIGYSASRPIGPAADIAIMMGAS